MDTEIKMGGMKKAQPILLAAIASLIMGDVRVLGQTATGCITGANAGPHIVTAADIQRTRLAEELKNRQEVDRLERKTLADLNSPDSRKRLSSVNCLSSWPITEANTHAIISGLTDALNDPDTGVRRRASLGLGQRGVKGITGRILDLLKQDPEGAYQYIDAIGLQGAPEGLPTLIHYTTSTNQFWRAGAAYALRHFSNETARAKLESSLNDSYWEVKYNAIQSLERLGDTRSTQQIVARLQDDNPLIVRTAISAVGRLGDDGTVTNLIGMLVSSNQDIRTATCSSLGQMKLKDARPVLDALFRSLDDPSEEVRMTAITALAQLGTVETAAALSKRIAHDYPQEEAMINRAVEMIRERNKTQ